MVFVVQSCVYTKNHLMRPNCWYVFVGMVSCIGIYMAIEIFKMCVKVGTYAFVVNISSDRILIVLGMIDYIVFFLASVCFLTYWILLTLTCNFLLIRQHRDR